MKTKFYLDLTPRKNVEVKPIVAKGKGKTDGRGLWSDHVTTVPFTLTIPSMVMEMDEGEFMMDAQAHFDTKHWSIAKHGLIYTDDSFERDIQSVLKKKGYKHYRDIGYSEQGQQGRNYVHLSIGDKLTKELIKKGVLKIKK